MALGRCDRCRNPMRVGSSTCPRCGRRKSRAKPILIGVIFAQIGIVGAYLEWPKTSGPRIVMEEGPPSVAPPVDIARPPAGWTYFQTEDRLIGDTTTHARVLSDANAAAAVAPTDHAGNGVLELRASPAYGRSVLLTFTRRAFNMLAEHVDLQAKFDDGAVFMFGASGAQDSTNATLVIDDYPAFVDKLAKSHGLSIDAKMAAGAESIVHFNVAGLKWN